MQERNIIIAESINGRASSYLPLTAWNPAKQKREAKKTIIVAHPASQLTWGGLEAVWRMSPIGVADLWLYGAK